MVDVSGEGGDLTATQASRAVLMKQIDPGRDLSRHRGKERCRIATARIAGIMAAKRTGELIPLCHPLGVRRRSPSRSAAGRGPAHCSDGDTCLLCRCGDGR